MSNSTTVLLLPLTTKPADSLAAKKMARSRLLTCLSVSMVIVTILSLTAFFLLPKNILDMSIPDTALRAPLSYAKVSGRDIVDDTGKVIKLRGANAGGWFTPESWMCGFDGLDNDWDYYNVTDSRFGEDKSRELFKIWNDNFFTERDFQMMAAMGYNFIRFPLHFRNFQNRDTSWIRKVDGTIDFDQLDKFVAMSGKYGIYVQLDLRVWNGRDIMYEGISKAEPWLSEEEASKTRLWRQQAVDFIGNVTEHFVGNPNILGIDAVNEPVPSYGDTLMIEMYNRIRQVDQDRIFIREFGVDRNDPTSRGWLNVIYSFHVYPNFTGRPFTFDEFKREIDDRISDNFAIPYQAGEFQLAPQDYEEGVKYMESKNINWAFFTFKAVKVNTWALFNYDSDAFVNFATDSFESIKNTWQTKLGDMNFKKMRSPLANARLDNAKVWF